MDMISAACFCIITFIAYKILDCLVRIPKIGKYEERYVFVTGCDTGFGHEICKRLDKMGCHVFAGCLTEKGETELRKCCSSKLKTVALNVKSSSSIKNAHTEIKKSLPRGKGLWGIINNAGIPGYNTPADWLSREDFQEVLDVNVLGLVEVTLTFLSLVKHSNGRIINMASAAGRVGVREMSPYCISKFGVESFSDCLRREFKRFGISVHVIEPGYYKTNILDADAMGRRYRSAWQKAAPDVKQDYGQEFVEEGLCAKQKTLDERCSERISDVLDAYEHALFGRFPRARYVVGKGIGLLIMLDHCLPEWMSDRLYNVLLYKHHPIPKAVVVGKYK